MRDKNKIEFLKNIRMNQAYALIFCESESSEKAFVFPRGQIKWPESADAEKKKKKFSRNDIVMVNINNELIPGRIILLSSKIYLYILNDNFNSIVSIFCIYFCTRVN